MRYYDPEAGRFISRDPLGMWGDPGQRGNAQNYCGNNPVNRVDPLGDFAPLLAAPPLILAIVTAAVIYAAVYGIYKAVQWAKPAARRAVDNGGILIERGAAAVAAGAAATWVWMGTPPSGAMVGAGPPRVLPGHASCFGPSAAAIPLPGTWPPPAPAINLPDYFSGKAKAGAELLSQMEARSVPYGFTEVGVPPRERQPDDKPVYHHVFPRQYGQWFQSRYGLDVDDYTIRIPVWLHDALHAGGWPPRASPYPPGGWWNSEIMSEINQVEVGLGRRLTAAEVVGVGTQFLLDYLLIGYLPYRRYPGKAKDWGSKAPRGAWQ